MGAEARQSGNFGCQVTARPGSPGSISAFARGWRPKRLAAVEVTGGPQTNGFFDNRRPVDAGYRSCEFGKGWYGCRCRSIHLGECPELRDICRLVAGVACLKGGRQVFIQDAATGDLGAVAASGSGQADAARSGKARGCFRKAFCA